MSRIWSYRVALVREEGTERISGERFEARYHALRVQLRTCAARVRMRIGKQRLHF